MSTIDVTNATAPVKRRRWQFSVKHFLVLTTICCVFVAMLAFPPFFVIAGIMLEIALFVFCLVAAIWGRGWIRPFSIFTAIPLAFSAFILGNAPFHHPAEVAVFLGVQLVASIIIGLSGAVSYGYLKRRSGLVPVPNVPFLRKWLFNPDPVEFANKG